MKISNIFSRSWEVTKLTFKVMKADKELILYPFLSGIFSIIFLLAMLFPTIITSLLEGMGLHSVGIFGYIIVFLTYLGLAFIATFFNVCVVYTAGQRFGGQNATPKNTLKYAFSKIHLIFAWSLVSATVGLILRIIDKFAQRLGIGGKIILGLLRSILGAVWSIITIFVVPVMVYKNLGSIDAIKESIQTLKKTWGESLVKYIGLGLIEGLFIIGGIIIGVILTILLATLGIYGIVSGILLTIIYVIAVIMLFSIANSIYNTALFVYAEYGTVPKGFNKEILNNAFRKQKQKGMLMPK